MSWKDSLDQDRAVGVIVRNGKTWLIHRFRDGQEYWCFPGGGVEEGESVEQALERELAEELGIKITRKKLLFKIENAGRFEHYFLIEDYVGEPKMGGPELEIMNEQNQYILEEINLSEISKINLFPPGIAKRVEEVQK